MSWIKDLCLLAGFDMAAIVDPVEVEAKTDMKRVIILALATPDESSEFTLKMKVDGEERWSKWIYEMLENRARKVALELIERNISAEVLEFTDSMSRIDLRKAAVLGGLGIMGENNLVLNRKWGPRLRFTAVFADIDEPVDRPLDIELCNMCTICIRECPTGALDHARFDRSKCIAEFDPNEMMAQRQEDSIKWISDHSKAQCSICITSCPIGMFNRITNLPGF